MPSPVGAYTGGAGSPLNPLDRFGRSCLMAAPATGPRPAVGTACRSPWRGRGR